MEILREYTLPNNITVTIADMTARYFAEYHTVVLELKADVTLAADCFGSEDEYKEAVKLLGKKVVYERQLQQKGVYEKDMAAVKQKLIADFEANSIPYISTADFPRRLIAAKLKEKNKKLEIEKLRKQFIESKDPVSR